jgi:hypothetical protein
MPQQALAISRSRFAVVSSTIARRTCRTLMEVDGQARVPQPGIHASRGAASLAGPTICRVSSFQIGFLIVLLFAMAVIGIVLVLLWMNQRDDE